MNSYSSYHKNKEGVTEELILNVRSNGREWEADNILIELNGTSGYLAYIHRIEEGEGEEVSIEAIRKGEDTITITLPSLWCLYKIINMLYNKYPLFRLHDKTTPNDCC